MLKFFRRIRWRLLGEGSLKKYLVYAVGEIALVMIGILLALQVNNWNELRKDKNKEQRVLIEIAETLNENTELLKGELTRIDSAIISGKLVISAIKNKQPYSDSMAYHIFKASYLELVRNVGGLSVGGYEFLKNQGFDLIQNHTLRKRIIALFEKSIPVYLSGVTMNQSKTDPSYDRMKELFFPRIGKNGDVTWTPFDYDRLFENDYYYSVITGFDVIKSIHRDRTQDLIQETQALLELLNDELNKFE